VHPLLIEIILELEDIYDGFEVFGVYYCPIGDGSPQLR
jgi:hypothetical protein